MTRTIDKIASVYTAECLALSCALDIALSKPPNNYLIFTDSESALINLQSNKHKISTNPYILGIKRKYNQFKNNNPDHYIKFFWIPSHIGIKGNKKADELAKAAPNMDKADPSIIIPYTDFFEE